MLPSISPQQLTQAALNQARDLGADIAGAVAWDRLMAGPSYAVQPFMPTWGGVGAGHPGRAPEPDLDFKPKSLVVVGVAHPGGRPELDWWQEHIPSRTLGNQALAKVTKGVARWLREEHGVAARDLAYHPERGGVFLKDAAVLAGLGVVGRSNLFMCPELGPRVRLRALAVGAELTPGEPLAWDPCLECEGPCRPACPQGAMAPNGRKWPPDAPSLLPGRDGAYAREACNRRMEADIGAGRMVVLPEREQPSKQVRYCRRCELACPVGRGA